jgi:hypothetical protein
MPEFAPQFAPHGACLAWDPHLLGLTVLGHLAMAVAYFGIPAALLTGSRVVLPGWLRIIFAGFIFLCGVSQFLDVIVIWRPVYWWLASELTLCGFVSLATLFYLPIAITALQRAETDAEPPRPPAD